MVRLNPRLLKSLSLKPIVLECDGCKADIYESQVYACVSLTFESLEPSRDENMTPDLLALEEKENEKRRILGEPPMERSEYIADIRNAELTRTRLPGPS
ncbi:MAG: hypothetical protein KIT79_08340 [Deltaproteobacteria bacterium]|nr:hypothetical protein [Deltaproteobacteria bacterium]